MIKGFTYRQGTLANTTIRAVLASTQIVFISDGEVDYFWTTETV